MSTTRSDADPPALRELAVLYESLRALTSTLDLGEVLRTLLARTRVVTSSQALSLLLYDPQREELIFAATEKLGEHTLIHADGDDVLVDLADAPERAVLRFTCPEQRAACLVLDGPVGAATFDAGARRRLALLGEALGPCLSQGIERDSDALAAFFERVMQALPYQLATLALHDAQGRRLVFSASRTFEHGLIDGVRISVERGIVGWVARNRQPVRLDDATADARHDPTLARRTGLVPHGMICVPLLHRGRLLGIVQVINRLDGRPFSAAEERLVQALADHAAVAIANAQLYHEVEQASLTDDLTGLGKTSRFHRTLARLLGGSQPLSLLVLDLDRLKPIVDTYGHLVGSTTIATVGRLIAAALRPGDTAARFGGDEFVVLLPRTDSDVAREIAERICKAVEACATPDGLDIDIRDLTASIGVATAPRHAADADGLFRAADAAMYAVKRARRNGVGMAEP